MHAILGFAASELSSRDSSVIPAAMTHRAKAIRAIKKRLAQPARRPGVTDSAAVSAAHREANAVVATCFALTFQSVGLDDGQAEYMTFIRGIAVVGMQMSLRGGKPIFATLEQDKADDVLEPLMRDLPLIERSWVDAAHDAMMTLRPLCVDPIEIQYYDKLMDIVNMLYINSWDGESPLSWPVS